MSFANIGFWFDGIHSTNLENEIEGLGIPSLNIVRIDTGMYGTPIGGVKNIISDKVAYKDSIYHYRTDLEVMEFSIIVTPLEKIWTKDYRYKIFKWLGSREPKEFRTDDDTGKLCYCICTNAMELITNGTQGYIELQFQATTPYWLTEVEESPLFDCTNASSESPIQIEVYNKSNVLNPKHSWEFYYYPKIYIDLKNGANDVRLVNTTDGNREFAFTNIATANDSLYIDNELKQIATDSGSIIVDNFNKNWLRLVYGKNIIQCYYPCIIKIVCQFPIYS